MGKCGTVICIDTSGSTHGNYKYFEKVKTILNSFNKKTIITWNSYAEITKSKEFHSDGGTRPQSFLKIIKKFKSDYNLIVTTDGQINNYELQHCSDIINSSGLLKNIRSFQIYFIGNERKMNLKISSLFNKVPKKQIIINNDKPIDVIHINLVEELKLSHFKDDKAIAATVLTLIQIHPDKKDEIRSQICKVGNRIMSELATQSSIMEYYEKGDIDGCVEFVKNYNNYKKKKFQQSMSRILNIFTKNDNYSLSHLSNANVCQKQDIQASLDDYDEGDDEQDFICDILLTKCSFPCILIKFLEDPHSENKDKYSIIPDKLNKKIAEHPFLILNHEDIIEKMVRRVEHQTIDLYAYNNLQDKSKSPFTRDTVKGVYIFHNVDAKYDLIFKNNNRTLSFIFGKNNKLPGNKAIWNVLFLYILIKYHPIWKEHENKLKEEIHYICKNATSLITITPILNPIISESFEVCLWYIFNVAPRAFENSSSNIIRYIEGSENFLQFYSYVSGKRFDDLADKLKIWNLWKYFTRGKVNKNLRLEVLSQIQNHDVIGDSVVLFSGESHCNNSSYNSKCSICKKFNVEPQVVFNLYEIFKKQSHPKLYDCVDFNALYYNDKKQSIIVKDNFNEKLLEHISICSSTSKPTVICPITGKHWKECSGSYDVNTQSYVKLFKRFCEAKKRYPVDENDLLVFFSNRINFNSNNVVVCPLNIKKCLKTVLDKYSVIINEHPVEEYIVLSNKDCGELERLDIEKACTKCNFHYKISLLDKTGIFLLIEFVILLINGIRNRLFH